MPQSENRPPLVIRHVDVGALVRAVEQPDFPHTVPMGATPPVQLVRDEPESADMGDALALDNAVVSYRFRWYWSLGGDAA